MYDSSPRNRRFPLWGWWAIALIGVFAIFLFLMAVLTSFTY